MPSRPAKKNHKQHPVRQPRATKIVHDENFFIGAKQVWKTKYEVELRNSDRIDKLYGMYAERLEDDGCDASIKLAQQDCDTWKHYCEIALEIIDGITYEQMIDDEGWEDPVLPFIPDRHGIKEPEDMREAVLIFRCLRPLGEMIERDHFNMVEDKPKESAE